MKDLRAEMNIDEKYDDNMIVCIYGRSDDIVRRTNEHVRDYKDIKSIVLRLKYKAYVDPQFLSQAETDVRNFAEAMKCKLSYKKENEMVIVDEKQLKQFESRYADISKKYMGGVSEFVAQIKEHEQRYINDMNEKEFEIKMLRLENEKFVSDAKISVMEETNRWKDLVVEEQRKVNDEQRKVNEERHKITILEEQLKREREANETNRKLLEERHRNEMLALENQMLKQQFEVFKNNLTNK